MSDSVTAAPRPRRRRMFVLTAASAHRRRRMTMVAVCLFVSVVSIVALARLTPDDRVLAAPMLAIFAVATVFMMVLWSRDGSPPVFESGTLCMLAIMIYGIMPMAGFVMMHGQWDQFADGRLQNYAFIPFELGAFGWRYVVYAAAFAATYLLVRGRATVKTTALTIPEPAAERAIIIVLVVLYTCRTLLKVVYGYDTGADINYADIAQAVADSQANPQPYFVQQIGHNLLSALFVAQLAVIALLLAHWRKRWCRYALVIWLGVEVLTTVIRLGSRGRAVLLLISAVVLYHRLVKRLSFRVLTVAGVLLLSGFLVLGAIRVVESEEAMRERAGHVLTAANEFQGLFATAFDIHKRRESGQIRTIPWQVYVSDFYFPIPSQFLPFEKVDPSSWYIDVLGQTGIGIGYMFGVMSQAAVGLDWIELVLRGAVLAACLALLHRWYVRRATYLWPTMLYLFVSIWTYYTFRASTFYFVYFVIYHFVPVFLATKVLEQIVSRVGKTLGRQPLPVRA